jgi:LmbE family N-acetylglucosaminyl deacetylase
LWQPPTVIFRYPAETDFLKEPGIDFLIDTTNWNDKKAAALRAHKTQRLGRLFFDDEKGRRTFSKEAFRVAWGPRPRRIPAEDLFAE